jgi:hypothetical protein
MRKCGKMSWPQMTIWRTRIACWIPKATDTHSDSVMLTASLLQQWLHEHTSMSRYSAFPVLFLGLLSTRLFLGLLSTGLFLGLLSTGLFLGLLSTGLFLGLLSTGLFLGLLSTGLFLGLLSTRLFLGLLSTRLICL